MVAFESDSGGGLLPYEVNRRILQCEGDVPGRAALKFEQS